MEDLQVKQKFRKLALIAYSIIILLIILNASRNISTVSQYAPLIYSLPPFLINIGIAFCIYENKNNDILITVLIFQLIFNLFTCFSNLFNFFDLIDYLDFGIFFVFQFFSSAFEVLTCLLLVIAAVVYRNKYKASLGLKRNFIIMLTVFNIASLLCYLTGIFISEVNANLFYIIPYQFLLFLSEIFTVLWLANDNQYTEPKATPQVAYTPPIQPQPRSQESKKQLTEEGKIKLLKEYKELLDTGILTQEEFEAKKKDIL